MLRLLILFCMAAIGAEARVGVVAVSTGAVFQGQVRLAKQGLLLVNAARDMRIELPLSNLTWVMFDAPVTNTPPPSSEGVIPEPWKEQDVGRVLMRGGTRFQEGVFRVRSGGMGIEGTGDSFHYVYQTVPGDFEMVARIGSLHQTHSRAKAGLMFRETLDGRARHWMVGMTPDGRGFYQWREESFGPVTEETGEGTGNVGWLKLKREGNRLAAYRSPNGKLWFLAGQTNLPFAGSAFCGMATTSGTDQMLNWTVFDRVGLGTNLINREFPPRAELISGSWVVGWPSSEDGDTLELKWGLDVRRIPMRAVSRIHFQWAPAELLGLASQNQSGLWMADGEFLEGDLRWLGGGRMRLNSVLHGARTVDVNSDVILMSLRPGRSISAEWSVTTLNGSMWLGSAIEMGENEVILTEPGLGPVAIPIQDLTLIQRRFSLQR